MGWSSGDRYERTWSLPKVGAMGEKKTALRENCQKLAYEYRIQTIKDLSGVTSNVTSSGKLSGSPGNPLCRITHTSVYVLIKMCSGYKNTLSKL